VERIDDFLLPNSMLGEQSPVVPTETAALEIVHTSHESFHKRRVLRSAPPRHRTPPAFDGRESITGPRRGRRGQRARGRRSRPTTAADVRMTRVLFLGRAEQVVADLEWRVEAAVAGEARLWRNER
jgi:hypothetical protein